MKGLMVGIIIVIIVMVFFMFSQGPSLSPAQKSKTIDSTTKQPQTVLGKKPVSDQTAFSLMFGGNR